MYIISKVRLSMTIIMLTVFYFQYYKIQFHCYIHSRLSCINCLSSLSKRTKHKHKRKHSLQCNLNIFVLYHGTMSSQNVTKLLLFVHLVKIHLWKK